jgi:hypothetical protein
VDSVSWYLVMLLSFVMFVLRALWSSLRFPIAARMVYTVVTIICNLLFMSSSARPDTFPSTRKTYAYKYNKYELHYAVRFLFDITFDETCHWFFFELCDLNLDM